MSSGGFPWLESAFDGYQHVRHRMHHQTAVIQQIRGDELDSEHIGFVVAGADWLIMPGIATIENFTGDDLAKKLEPARNVHHNCQNECLTGQLELSGTQTQVWSGRDRDRKTHWNFNTNIELIQLLTLV